MGTESREFEQFALVATKQLTRALTSRLPRHAVSDAVAEALAYAWKEWPRVRGMEAPVGYLFRVALSRSRQRRQGLAMVSDRYEPIGIEPNLVAAFRRLSRRQQSVVWLVDACGWTYRETGDALAMSASAVGTHRARGIAKLRTELGVDACTT